MGLAGVFAALLLGCASRPSLEVRSADFNKTYTHDFTRACFRQRESGEFQVVLIEDPGADHGGHRPEAPAADALQQVVEINVLWRPKSTKPIDTPMATNATLSWTVFSTDPARKDRLEYTGAALVRIDPHDGAADISIRNARLTPRLHQGEIQDPVGHCSLFGSFTAVRNPSAVEAALAEVRENR